MSEIRTNILISGESSEYRSNIKISIVTLNSALVDTHSSFRTNLDITTTLKDGSISAIKTNLELNNVALKFYLVDMTKLKQSLLYFSKFFNMYFEPEVMWDLLAQGTNEQINISHLNEALSNYVKVDITNNILTDLERVKLNLQEHIKDNKKHFTEKEKEFLLNLMENPSSFGSGDSLFEKVNINQNNIILPAVKPLKQDGKDAGIISNTFISCRGIDSTASSGSGGITRIDLFNILSGEPISYSEFINNKFLKISPLIEDWIRQHLKEFETDPTVSDFIKKITEEQIKSWDAVASWFDISEDKSYIFTTNERGFVSHSFISCKGLDLNAASSGSSFSRSELFDILSENPQEGERINLKYLIGLEELVESFGFLKDINKNQVITALGYTPLKKEDFKDFATVSNIVKQDVDNWNFVFSLIDLSEDESYIFPKENRGFVSNSFISCKGLDETAPQIGGTFDRSSLFEILSNKPQDGEFIDLRFLNLNDYVTIDYITSQGYITSNALSGYATQQWVLNKNYASQDDLTILREDFDNLSDVLNGNVGGVIDTWNEVVSFLDGYKDSEDLATILSGMNTDIANRVLIEDFEKLEEAVNPLFGYFDANGNVNNALKLDGHSAEYFATADALNTHIKAFNTYKTTTDDRLNKLEDLWYMDKEGNVHTTHNIVVDGGGAFGMGAESGDIPSASVSIKFDGSNIVYSPVDGIITLPAYPSGGGGVADSVDWAKVYNKPTTLGGYGIIDALSTSGGKIDSTREEPITINSNQSQVRLLVQRFNTSKSTLGWHENFGTWMYDHTTGKSLGIRDTDGTPFYYDTTFHTLIHSGIIGDYAMRYYGNQGAINFNDVLYNGIQYTSDSSSNGGKHYGVLASFWCWDSSWQIVGGRAGGDLLYRSGNGTSTSWGDWKTIAFTSDLANYLPLSGGILNGPINLGQHDLIFQGSDTGDIVWNSTDGIEVARLYNNSGTLSLRHNAGTTYSLIHSGNYSNYALPLNGGTINGPLNISSNNDYKIILNNTDEETNFQFISFRQNGVQYGSLGTSFDGILEWNGNDIIHSGNINSYNTGSATKLQTARTIWGQLFDGSADVSGALFGATYIRANEASVNGIYLKGSSYTSVLGESDIAIVTPKLAILNGNVLIGTTTDNGAKLQVFGNLTVTGGGAFGSDIRYKDITSYRQLDLETIANAPLFSFKWTDREDKVEHLGTSAQYWLGTQFKDAVNTANKDFFHLDYGALAVGIGISVAREVKGVKTEVEVLKERANQLEQELAQYRRA